ncbi:hypothetical protein LCGC14_1658390 [marine sediment metagenome]|uniref:Uncharacterized protein n=1 Tax=marine sediment metagenome TaxID=412755 RepID=A0A0F9HVJ7_9ZZZZ
MINLRYCPSCYHWCLPNPERYYGKRATVQTLIGCVDCGTLTRETRPEVDASLVLVKV